MIDADQAGGWVLIEDIDWLVFDSQELPEPFATLHRTVRTAYTANAGYDGEWGRRMLATMRAVGLRGRRLARHRAHHARRYTECGVVRDGAGAGRPCVGRLPVCSTQPRSPTAIAQAREPDFAVLSPLSISAWGRKAG